MPLMLPLDTISGTGGLDTPTGNLFAESGKMLCICWYISLRTSGSIHLQYSTKTGFGENVQSYSLETVQLSLALAFFNER